MNAVIMLFDPNERESYETYESSRSDSVKLARKAKDKLHKACETLHRQEQNRMRMASMRESALLNYIRPKCLAVRTDSRTDS